jgi:trehalose-phosphatase
LRGLRDVLHTVAIVTGRGVDDASAMVDVDGLDYIGNHGLEFWHPISGAHFMPEARPWVPRLARVLEDVRRQLPQDGIIVENKGVTGSLHYRQAPRPVEARRALLEILARSALTSGVRVEEGRMVINVLPPLTVSKGSAVTWLVREHQLDRLAYFGDDLTDAHAFRALAILRQTGEVRALGIGVVGPETPLTIKQLADASVPTVEAVADLLCELLARLRSHPRSEC